MKLGQLISDSAHDVDNVYFPLGGVLSCVVDLENGSSIESGMIGNDGEFGAAHALNGRVSVHRVLVQVPSEATVVSAIHLRALARTSPRLLSLLMKYEQFFLAQVQQTTACNASHQVEQRMCKWLVRMFDLAGDELPLTQDFLAQMMGVRRTSVTGVAARLQKEGLITYRRGRLKILNIENVERRACLSAEDVSRRVALSSATISCCLATIWRPRRTCCRVRSQIYMLSDIALS